MEPCLPQIDQVCLSQGKAFSDDAAIMSTFMNVRIGVTLPLLRLAVDQFTSTGLDALGQKLGRLDMARAADISRQACAGEDFLLPSMSSYCYQILFRPQFPGACSPLSGEAKTTQP